jgi:hypothetical protein
MNNQFTDREQVVETINKLFVYTDNQEWRKLQEEVFTEQVLLDMVSMGAPGVERVSAREICYRWEAAFKELDAVHHQAGNYIVQISDQQANVTAYAIAIHYKESASSRKGKTREYVGSYDLHLEKGSNGWRIDQFKYHLKYSAGNMALV